MSVKVTVNTKWEGKEVKVLGKKVVGKTMFEVGLVVEGQAKLLCPIDYGYLAASINVQAGDGQGTEMSRVVQNSSKEKVKKKDQHRSFWEGMPEGFHKITKPDSDMEVLVGTAVEYGPHIEFGTIHMDAQPFLRPALDLAKGKTLHIGLYNGKYYLKDYLQ